MLYEQTAGVCLKVLKWVPLHYLQTFPWIQPFLASGFIYPPPPPLPAFKNRELESLP